MRESGVSPVDRSLAWHPVRPSGGVQTAFFDARDSNEPRTMSCPSRWGALGERGFDRSLSSGLTRILDGVGRKGGAAQRRRLQPADLRGRGGAWIGRAHGPSPAREARLFEQIVAHIGVSGDEALGRIAIVGVQD